MRRLCFVWNPNSSILRNGWMKNIPGLPSPPSSVFTLHLRWAELSAAHCWGDVFISSTELHIRQRYSRCCFSATEYWMQIVVLGWRRPAVDKSLLYQTCVLLLKHLLCRLCCQHHSDNVPFEEDEHRQQSLQWLCLLVFNCDGWTTWQHSPVSSKKHDRLETLNCP